MMDVAHAYSTLAYCIACWHTASTHFHVLGMMRYCACMMAYCKLHADIGHADHADMMPLTCRHVVYACWHVVYACWHVVYACWHVVYTSWHVVYARWHVVYACWHVVDVCWHVVDVGWHVT